MRYAKAQRKRKRELDAYRIYVTEGLRMLTENTAGGNLEFLNQSYVDMLNMMEAPPKPQQTGEEIVAEVMSKFNLKFTEE